MVGAETGPRPVAGRSRRAVAAPLCDRAGMAADLSSGRELAVGDRGCSEPFAWRYGGDGAPLPRPHRPDLCHYPQSGPPLVLVPADAAGRGAGVQSVRLAKG